MAIGKGTTLQIGQETTWGTAASPTTAVNYTSESLALDIERNEEDSLVGGKTSRSQDIMKYSTSGGFNLIAKPGNIGLLLGLTLGVEADAAETSEGSGVYQHVFTPIASGQEDVLPFFTAIIDRVVACKAYTGQKISSISIKCEAGDYMRIEVTCAGRAEESGTVDSTLAVPTTKAFRFAGGSCTFDGTSFGSITSVTIDYNNNLDDGAQTLASGYYGTEQNHQSREIRVSFEAIYDSDSESLRENFYKTESTLAASLTFSSPDEIVDGTNYSVQFDMPLVSIDDCQPNVDSAEKLTVSVGGLCLESSTQEALTVTLTDAQPTNYLA